VNHDDALADIAAAAAGGWDGGPYGSGDALGTYREVTAAKRAAALALLDLRRPVGTFNLGETLFVGYPGWGGRSYAQRLAVGGLDPGDGFGGDVVTDRPRGPNLMSTLEERVTLTYNMGSKINGLAHAGVGMAFYAGRRLPDLIGDAGVTELDTATWGPPLLTRGLLVDVLGALREDGIDALDESPDGQALLRGDYRITMDDLERAISRQRLPPFEPGDAVFIRTGWRHLIRTDPERYLGGSPGVWLRETRWLASFRPALVGTDSWCWGNNDRAVVAGAHGACHQELILRHGIRIAEGVLLEELAHAGVDRFVLCHNPIRAAGAVSTLAPAMAIANIDEGRVQPVSTSGGPTVTA